MFYRMKKARRTRQLNRAISGILDTPPLQTAPAPWCIASMVANGDVAMYLLTLKSFYPKLGRGKVAVIVDRDMPQSLRDTLSRHVPGIEFVILEDISTGACQRGGTWERLLYVLDRSTQEYTIQLDADTLTVGEIEEVVWCVENNIPFTISDGFEILPLAEVAEEAEATPSNYIGIVTECKFAGYPDPTLRYVRGSSGFAGFSRGGFTRAAITRFHQEMEKRVGATRWREWGTEQCGSNFAIANSPDAVVLPYPEYASFTRHAARSEARFFHFIGANRFLDSYYAARGQQVIAELRASSIPMIKSSPPAVSKKAGGMGAFARGLTGSSALAFLAWRLGGRRRSVWLRVRSASEFPGPEFQLRPEPAADHDVAAANQVFVERQLYPPVRIPPERVKLIVSLGADGGLSCLWWLASYWRTELLAFESTQQHAVQWRLNLQRNGLLPRATLLSKHTDLFALLAGRRVDIMKIDGNDSGRQLLADRRFRQLDVRVVVLRWDEREELDEEYFRYARILQEMGFKLITTAPRKTCRVTWAHKQQSTTRPSVAASFSVVAEQATLRQ